MFGEKPIKGYNFTKVQNNKIVLPKFTFSEKDDELLVLKIYEDYIVIEKNLYLSIIQTYENRINETPLRDEKIKLMKRVKSFYYAIKQNTKCDEKHRITVPHGLNGQNMLLEGKNKYLLMIKEV